jgi:DNA polymerase delta subunit 1
MEFFAVSWHGDDERIDDDDDDEEEDDPKKQYVVRVFGRTADGRSACCAVDFYPYFFVSLPKRYGNVDAGLLRKSIVAKMGRRFSRDVVEDACVVVRRKKFYGFTGGETHPFLRMVFRTRHAYAVAAKIVADVIAPEKAIVGERLDLYESNVDPVLKLIHCRDLDASGWLRVTGGGRKPPTKKTACDVEIVARYDALSKLESDARPAIVIASFDIETDSRDGNFPDPDLEGNEVIQIATVYQRYGEPEPFAREVLCLGETASITDDIDVRCFYRESEVLAAWSKSLRTRGADILVGFNVWGFDMNYMYRRAMFNYEADADRETFLDLGKIVGATSSLRKTVLSSSAYGHNEFSILETPGILQIDLLHVLRKEHKLESYSLNNVSRHFLGDEKIDMPAKTMFALYATRDPVNLAKIAEYCVKDCELPLRLLDKLAVVPNMIEMSRATHVPMDYLIVRGQQIKVFSQILKRLREKGYVCPANPKKPGSGNSDGGYVGATVLEPKRGAYMDHPIATLDFASLYPSIMRAHRLCPSTIVLDPAYANMPGVEYLTIDVEGTEYKFAQNTEAVVPDLLRDLAQYRKQAKKDMADAKRRGDAFMTSVYDGKQLAIKVSMNSAYGFFGAINGYLPCAPIAAAVTTIGRRMIDQTKNFVEETYEGAEVVYGDT